MKPLNIFIATKKNPNGSFKFKTQGFVPKVGDFIKLPKHLIKGQWKHLKIVEIVDLPKQTMVNCQYIVGWKVFEAAPPAMVHEVEVKS